MATATRFSRPRTIVGLAMGLAIAGLVTAGTVQAQAGRGRGFRGPQFSHQGPGGPGGPGAIMRGLRALDLTDAQREQVRVVFEQYRPQFDQLGTQARESGEALRDAMTADAFDEGAIRSAHQGVAAAQVELAVLGSQARRDVMNLLTPEQRQRAAELKAEREKRMQERRQRMEERRQQRRNR